MEIAVEIGSWLTVVPVWSASIVGLAFFVFAAFLIPLACYCSGHVKAELERDLGFRDRCYTLHVVEGKHESCTPRDSCDRRHCHTSAVELFGLPSFRNVWDWPLHGPRRAGKLPIATNLFRTTTSYATTAREPVLLLRPPQQGEIYLPRRALRLRR